MPSVTLKNGRDKADFIWDADIDVMTVVIDVKAMRNSQTGRMTKDAGRLLWNTLKSEGFEECPKM